MASPLVKEAEVARTPFAATGDRVAPTDAPGTYRLFGVRVESHVPLPLPASDGPAEISVELGHVAISGELVYGNPEATQFCLWRDGQRLVVRLDDQVFEIAGNHIVIDGSVADGAVDLLVNTVWSVVMSLRGVDPLHGIVVARDGKGLAVLGPSGSGKSTAALRLIEQGWSLITDDLVVLDDELHVVPGPSFVRLRTSQGLMLPAKQSALGKFHVPSPRLLDCHVPLGAVIVHDDAYTSVARATGLEAARLVIGSRFLPFEVVPGQFQRRLDTALALCANVAVFGAPPRSLTVPDMLATVRSGIAGR